MDTQTQHQTAAEQKKQNGEYANYPTQGPTPVPEPEAKSQDSITPKTEKEGQWYTKPDWWVAGFTGLLFAATTGLWVFTALLWNATRQAVKDTADSLKHAEAAASAATKSA